MKYLLQLAMFLFLFQVGSVAQELPCRNEIVTDPNGPPYNPQIWIPGVEHFINTDFNWMETVNLPDMHIVNMGEDGNEELYMQHLFSTNNPHNLSGLPFEELDMWPSDGWELISMNTGKYPDGTTLLSEGQGTAAPETPYVILYNKQRSVLRVFVNSMTGLGGHLFDAVKVSLRFVNPEGGELTGLLRHFNQYDQALDKPTSVTEIASFAPDPGSQFTWTHVDFQMAYDPCTCSLKSNLELKFQFFDTMSIEGAFRELGVSVPLDGDGDGQLDYADFLAGVNYSEGHATAGAVVYSTMGGMLDDYIARMQAVRDHNEQVDIDNKKIDLQLTIVKTFKSLTVGAAADFIVGGLAKEFLQVGEVPDAANGSARQLTTLLGNMSQVPPYSLEWNNYQSQINALTPTAKVWPNQKSVTSKAKEFLGKEFDKLFTGLKKKEKMKAPTMPIAMLSEGTFSGEISNHSAEIGPVIFNPGSFPFSNGTSTIEPENYPAYNEVLGGFALLKTPVFLREKVNASVVTGETDSEEALYRLVDNRVTNKMKLSEPLKFAVNPNLPHHTIDIKATIVMKGHYSYSPDEHTEFVNFNPNDPFNVDDINHLEFIENYNYTQFNLESNEPFRLLEGVDQFNTLEGTIGIHKDFELVSPTVPLEVLNEMVFGYDLEAQTAHVDLFNGATPYWDTMNEFHGAWYEDFEELFNVQHDLYLKLQITYDFEELGEDGSENSMVELLTYQIGEEDFSEVESFDEIPFNLWGVPLELSLPFDLHFDGEYELPTDPDYVYRQYLDGSVYTIPAIVINVNGDLTTSNGIEVNFVAQDQISITPDVSISPEVSFSIEQMWTTSPSEPVTENELSDFCSDEGDYLANLNNGPKSSNSGASDDKNQKVYPMLKIGPNPSSEFVNISIINSKELVKLVTVYDSSGKILIKEQQNNRACRLNVSGLTSGFYFIEVESKSGLLQSRFVKE